MADDVTSPAKWSPRAKRSTPAPRAKATTLVVVGLVMNRGGACRQILAVGDRPRSTATQSIRVATAEAP